jgi:Tfp pilus assembly protein PilX
MIHRLRAPVDPRRLATSECEEWRLKSCRVRSGERGSAFMVALAVLVVLTITGLALTLMSQTELRIGSNEREANRTFYATDAGVHFTAARDIWFNDKDTFSFTLNTTLQDNPAATSPTTFSDQVLVTPLYAIHVQPCNFCSINENQPGGEKAYITAVVNVTTSRVGTLGKTNQVYAQKLIGTMIGMQPFPKDHGQYNGPPPTIKF